MLLRSGLKVGVKVATAGALSAADLTSLAQEVAEEASTLSDTYIGEMLTKQTEQKAMLQAFKDALAELPSLIAPSHEDGSITAKPLIFIIDELDRCKPLFALNILERIKHFFSVPNVHFVLGCHLKQLNCSVQVAYGNGINAELYLQKFIHLTFHLIDESRYHHERISRKFIDNLIKSMGYRPADNDIVRTSADFVQFIADTQGLSLRSLERIYTSFSVAMAFSSERAFRPPPILAGLCILKVLRSDLYEKAKQGQLKYSEALSALSLDASTTREHEYMQTFAIQWWRYCLDTDAPEDLVKRFSSSSWQLNINDRFDIVPLVANYIIDRLATS